MNHKSTPNEIPSLKNWNRQRTMMQVANSLTKGYPSYVTFQDEKWVRDETLSRSVKKNLIISL